MTCGELRAAHAAYALGIAREPERTEIAEHLARNCSDCAPGVAEAAAAVSALSRAKQPKRSGLSVYLPWAITVAVSAALLAIGIAGRRQVGDTVKLQRALAILNDPAAQDVTFGNAGGTGTPSKGRVVVSAGKGVVFIGASLPHIDSDKTFELWMVPAKGNPLPAGVFQSQPDATAVFVGAAPVDHAAEIEVTVEPEGGSPQPTTTPFVAVRF